VSGQELCQVFAPALFATQWLLFLQNKKLIRLTALPATVLKNRHIFSFTLTDASTLPVYEVIFCFHFGLVSVPASSLMSSACIVYRKLLKLVLT